MKKNVLFLSTIICIIIGIVLREAYLLKYPVPVRDSYKYYEFIKEWNSFSEGPTNGKYPPLGLFILKIPYSLYNYDIIKGSTLINNILGVAIIILAIRIAFLLSNNYFTTISTGLIFGTHPTLVKYSCEAIRENTYIFFLFLSFLELIIK